MLYDILFVVAAVGLLFCLTFGRMILKSEIEQCRYNLYEIRDSLILLVANKTIKEESIVFKHYYKYVNDLLKYTEKMKFEETIKTLLFSRVTREDIRRERDHLKQVAEELKNSPPEVRDVITDFYRFLNEMFAVNSNFFDVRYKLFRHHRKIAEALANFGFTNTAMIIEKGQRKIEKEQNILGLAV